MTCLVTLNLGAGDCDRGFDCVTARLWRPDQGEQMQFTAALPPAPELLAEYQRWQQIYLALQAGIELRRFLDPPPDSALAFDVDETDLTNVAADDLLSQGQRLTTALNQWLTSPEFIPLDQQLRTHLDPSEAIQVIIQTGDPGLRQLPWHLWQFFEAYPAAEPALGSPSYRSIAGTSPPRATLRILAVLGNGRGIDVAADRRLLSQLPQAEVTFLVEPSRAELDQWLWQDQGWDILFFAGHSATLAGGTQGQLAINPQRQLGIADLRHALSHAISRGLTLALFNACDGLGLAYELEDLDIPQLVVMREPVPDLVAQAFLKLWLQRFASGLPLSQSLRQARQQLQGLEDEFPGASWLPVMCQNPATLPLRWPGAPAPSPALRPSRSAMGRNRQQMRNRQALLNRVKQDWIEGLLDKSLHGQAVISLGLDAQPQALACPWALDLGAESAEPQPLPEDIDIVTVYDQLGAGCTLLLLGEPGAGKTTTLLTLARTLVSRAQVDDSQLIPVVLNLSTWASRKDDFRPWLLAELKTKYRVPSKISRQWIDEQELLLLLDGLDEVAAPYRDGCIRSLNQFSQETGLELVVCCRAKDYGDCRQQLAFQSALYLRPLSLRQVRQALAAAGQPLAALSQMIDTQPIWQELAQSPLILDLMMLTYQGLDVADLPQAETLDAHRHRLFAAYLQRMFQRRRGQGRYPPPQVVRQLAWLAQQMRRHAQSVFLLEALQMSWLNPGRDRVIYAIAVRALIWLLWGGLHVGILAGLTDNQARFDWGNFAQLGSWGVLGGVVYGVLAGLSQQCLPSWGSRVINSAIAAGLFGGLFSQVGYARALETGTDVAQTMTMWGLSYGAIYCGVSLLMDWQLTQPIRPLEVLRWSGRKALAAAGLGLVVTLALALGPQVGVPQSLVFGGMVAIAGGFDKRNTVDETTTRPNQGIRQALKNAALLFSTVGLMTLISIGLLETWVSGVANGILLGVAAAILVAGITATKHYVLRAMLAWRGHAPWRYRRFLDHSVKLIFLRRVGGGYVFVHRLLLDYLADSPKSSLTRPRP